MWMHVNAQHKVSEQSMLAIMSSLSLSQLELCQVDKIKISNHDSYLIFVHLITLIFQTITWPGLP